MEIMVPKNEFDFTSTMPSAPMTPKRFGEVYFSAPPSPDHLSELYRDFDDFFVDDTQSCSYSAPMAWWEDETNPVEPNLKREKTIFDEDFAFDVSGEIPVMTLPAEELFERGQIRPIKPPIKAEPRYKNQSFDVRSSNTEKRADQEKRRERGREISSLPSSSSKRVSRSVSPLRVSKYPWEEEEDMKLNRKKKENATSTPAKSEKPELTSTTSSLTSSKSKKWRLKDFFLFRSASEGRSSGKDPLRKYRDFFRKNDEKKISSNKNNEGISVSKRRGPVSAHELHYTKNRAVSEDLKKKTYLPYKQGILGRLSFNPATHALSNGYGYTRK